MATEHLLLDDLLPHARAIADDIVWATMTTVGTDGRPRGRVVHPVWQWTEEAAGPIGYLTTRPTPVKQRHLAAHPVASFAYWSPKHDALFVDVDVAWLDRAGARRVWDLVASLPPPVGFDPAPIFPDGPDGPGYAALALTVRRVQVVLAARMAAGEPSLLWTDLATGGAPAAGQGGAVAAR